MTVTVNAAVADLPSLSRQALVSRWQDVFKQLPPANLSVQRMRSAIAYELQSGLADGLSKRARDELRRVAISPKKKPARQPRAGAQLVREWNGVPHIVDIVESGYLYRGQTYTSLTAIAFEITGARWSGPRFFGLKSRVGK
jgi:Protein of unknown function (DUF2924)